MNRKFNKLFTLLLVLCLFTSSIAVYGQPTVYKPVFVDNYYLDSGKSIAWEPDDGFVQPDVNGTMYSRVVYLSRLEAMAVAEGYRDSAFQSEMVRVLDYAQRTLSYSGGYLAATTIVNIATQLGCKSVAKFFAGAGGAVFVGFLVDDFLNMIRYMDYNAFKNAIDLTKDNYFVQVKIGIASKPGTTVPIREYAPWNLNPVQGIPSFHGKWTHNIRF